MLLVPFQFIASEDIFISVQMSRDTYSEGIACRFQREGGIDTDDNPTSCRISVDGLYERSRDYRLSVYPRNKQVIGVEPRDLRHFQLFDNIIRKNFGPYTLTRVIEERLLAYPPFVFSGELRDESWYDSIIDNHVS